MRTDHVTEAKSLLGLAECHPSADWPVQTGERKADIIATAQVHALLAIAESLEAIVKTDDTINEVVGIMGAERASREFAEAVRLNRQRTAGGQ